MTGGGGSCGLGLVFYGFFVEEYYVVCLVLRLRLGFSFSFFKVRFLSVRGVVVFFSEILLWAGVRSFFCRSVITGCFFFGVSFFFKRRNLVSLLCFFIVGWC